MPTVRPPRLGGNERRGVFATRSPFRPNNLGLSCVKLEKIKTDKNLGKILVVSGVDLLDNTPIFDIKPYIPYCDCKPDATGSFSDSFKDYKIDVFYDEDVFKNIDLKTKEQIIKIIEQDPAPSYKTENEKYAFVFSNYEICFEKLNSSAKILSVNICK